MSSSSLPYASKVEETLRLAGRRRLLVEAAEQLAWTLGILASGFASILLFGTVLLGRVPVMLFLAVSFIFAAYRLRKRSLSPYRIAQVLDQRLSLHDTLSTAHFLLSNSQADDNQAARFQLEQAGRIAETVRVGEAFPFRGKRAWILCGALAGVSFGLFALRFFVTQSLSLQPPMIALQMPPVMERLEEALRPKQQEHVPMPPLPRRYPADPTRASSTEAKDNGSLPTEASEPAGANDRNGDLTKSQTQTAGKGSQKTPDSKQETREGGQKSSGGEGAEKTEERNEPQTSPQNAPSREESGANGQSNSPGLMNRMKNALSNMMAKMRANGAPQQGEQRSETGQDQAKNNQDASAAAKQAAGNERQNGSEESSENQNAEGQAQGQTSERPQNAQGRSSDQSAQKGSDSQSGVGRQDGDKGIKDAEQLRAMGKLAELIGKRSANLTGEMTVETPSGKQQLKTAYSQQTGRHSDSGGEINRNEIPMMYQQYVRDYMEHVRKQAQSKP